MAENTVKVDISFRSLLEAVSLLEISEKRELWQFLEAELFPEEEYSTEDLADIRAARADYEAGDYVTFDQYRLQRKKGALGNLTHPVMIRDLRDLDG